MSWATSYLTQKERRSRQAAVGWATPRFPANALQTATTLVAWAQRHVTVSPQPVAVRRLLQLGAWTLGTVDKLYAHPSALLQRPQHAWGQDDFACLLYAGLHQLARRQHLLYLQMLTLLEAPRGGAGPQPHGLRL